ncbi:MAG: NUDIX hydrolase [Pseudomonadales bacterium]|nr:NUDIX hydrolase [Pseudomonadales bacterium]
MKYCGQCGETIVIEIPAGDNRERHVCSVCTTVHYENPRIIAGCLPVFERKVLLCKRAIEPRSGYWTLPAGFMENGETTSEGAIRECEEEACFRPEIEKLYCLYNIPDINQVYFFYLAHLKTPEFAAGEESLEVRLFSEEEIPWEELAFHTIRLTLQHYFEDRKTGSFPFREKDLVRRF